MTTGFDNRLVTLAIEIDGKAFAWDQDFYILATGKKYSNGTIGECALRIDNISKITRDFLVNKTSPWIPTRTYINMNLSVGRASVGTFLLFTGQASAANPTQPPDIGLTFTSLTSGALLGNIGNTNAGSLASFKSIATQIAASLPNPATGTNGIPLDYRTDLNPMVDNYSFSGALIKQVDVLNALGNGAIYAFIHNNVLVVTDLTKSSARQNHIISSTSNTQMVGVPEVNELGVRVKALIGSEEIQPMDTITIQSVENPAANGTFYAYTVGYEIASRDTTFYWILDCRAYAVGAGQ
jgi:hypothetical protein